MRCLYWVRGCKIYSTNRRGFGFEFTFPLNQPSTLIVPPLFLPVLRIDLALHTYCRLPAQTFRCRPPLQTPGAHITYLADLLCRLALPSKNPFSALAFWGRSEPQSFLCLGLLGRVRASMFPSALAFWGESGRRGDVQ